MKKLISLTRQFRDDQDGAAMVEYSVLIGIITALAIGLIIAVGGYVTGAWDELCTNLDATTIGCDAPA